VVLRPQGTHHDLLEMMIQMMDPTLLMEEKTHQEVQSLIILDLDQVPAVNL
jgi:hypothetical protein